MSSAQRVSDYTASVINALVNRGILFSYATARSLATSSKVTRGITAIIPVITNNGAFIIDSLTGEFLHSNFFGAKISSEILSLLTGSGIYPIVYAYIDGAEKFSYLPEMINDETKWFLGTRQGDIRHNPVNTPEELHRGWIFYLSCIDSNEKLQPIYQMLNNTYTCIYHRDFYSGDLWLEILPAGVSKAQAALKLKKILNCDRIVSFGDDINDIPLFEASDECYAVENAVPELKRLATGVIGGNDEDAVAKWLQRTPLYSAKYKGKSPIRNP